MTSVEETRRRAVCSPRVTTRTPIPVAASLAASLAAAGLAALLGPACVLDWDPAHRTGSSSSSSSSGAVTETCGANETCTCVVGQGDCVFSCISGGTLNCGASGSCTLDCPGGGCTLNCDQSPDCKITCLGGGCTENCGSATTCVLDCLGGGCVKQ